MKTLLKISVLAVITLLFSCNLFGPQTGEELFDPTVIKLPQGGNQVIKGINQLGFDVLRQVTDKKCTPANNMISPFSLSTVLSMLYQGSNGQTLDELTQIMYLQGLDKDQVAETYHTLLTELPDVDKKKVTFSPANSLWIKQGFDVNQTYKNFIADKYMADIFERAFDQGTVDEINQWVNDKTNGKITKIIDDLNGYVAALLNAIYFHGQWLDQFPKENTTQMPFYTDEKLCPEVDMMNDEISYMRLGANDSLLIGELYYGHGNYSFVVLLPYNGYSLKNLVLSMDADKFANLMQELSEAKDVPVYLPKFKFEFKYEKLKERLINLGLQTLFTSDAGLDGINPDLYIDKIVQKTFVEVNEQGTEAAATTGAMAMDATMPQQELRVDHPFMFAIRETTTGLILFLGTVVNPTENE